MFINLFDSHSHSENSPDAHHSVTFMAEAAVARGLQGLAITDHCEGDVFYEEDCEKRIRQSALDTAMAKAAFGKRLILTFGVEVGQVFYNRNAIEQLLSKLSFDFILGSVHKLQYKEFDIYCADYSALSPGEIHDFLEKYFEELKQLIEWGGFDALAHLDFPFRYLRRQNIDISLERYRGHVDDVLRLLVESGKALEVNTSGLEPGDAAMPPAWVVERYRALGGELVTIGSDAHNAERLGAGISGGMSLIAGAGYEYFAFYRGRKPVMLRII